MIKRLREAFCVLGLATGSVIASGEPLDQLFTNESEVRFLEALRAHDFNACRQSITSGISVNVRGKNGETPLWFAVRGSDLTAFCFLLENGANVLDQVSNSYNIMELCAAEKNPAFLNRALAAGGRANLISQYYRQTPIFSAATNGNIENLEFLIKNGACVDISDPYGMTPVMAAARVGSFSAVMLLLKSGADYNVTDIRGSSLKTILERKEVSPKTEQYGIYKEVLKFLQSGTWAGK